MSVFLRFGDTKLGKTELGNILSEGVFDFLGWKRDGQLLELFVIARRADIVERENTVSAYKAVKVLAGKRVSYLPCPVWTEIYENNAVAGFNHSLVAADNRNDKFIGYALFIAVFNCGNGIRVLLTLAENHGVIALFNSVPAVVPVHGVKSALNGSNFTQSDFTAFFNARTHEARSGGRADIAPVQKGMNVNLLYSPAFCHLNHRKKVRNVAVNSAVGQKSHKVKSGFVLHAGIHCFGIYLVVKESAVLDFI